MTSIATAHAASTASPAAFFAKWADVDTWPEWNSDIDWVRLDGPFVSGATGTLEPKGGPAVTFVIERLVPDREFVDVSKLIGARLTLWTKVLGADLVKAAQPDLDSLVAAAEEASCRAIG